MIREYYESPKAGCMAGTPYIIKWTSGNNLGQNDLVFSCVTIDAMMKDKVCNLDDGKSITFRSTYDCSMA